MQGRPAHHAWHTAPDRRPYASSLVACVDATHRVSQPPSLLGRERIHDLITGLGGSTCCAVDIATGYDHELSIGKDADHLAAQIELLG
jgi:hypothetical protein